LTMALRLSSKKLLAIDWDRADLRLVLVRPQADGVDLLKAVSVPIPPEVSVDDAESLGAFLREAMRQSKISAKLALLSIPRDQVVLNSISLPASPAAELASIVQFQVVKELPFAVDQATLDFAVSGDFDPKEACNVLVAAVRNEQLDFYRGVAREAGLTVERVGLRPHANLIAVLAKAPELERKTLLMVEVGPQLTEISIIREGVLAFSRAASVTLSELQSTRGDRLQDSRIDAMSLEDHESDETAREAVSELMVEVIRSFEAYRATEPGVGVDQIVVCGATGIESQLAESLAARFAAKAEMFTPYRALNLTPQRAGELRGFSAALGLAIGHGGKGLSHFDFLHPKKPVSKRKIRLKKVPTAVLTVLFILAAGFTFDQRYIKPLTKEAEPLLSEVNSKKKEEDAILDFKDQIEALEDWQKSEQYWPDVLVTLTEVFPPEREAFVTRLEFETRRPAKKKSTLRPSSMRMRLRTTKMGTVNELSAKLRELGFMEVETGRETEISGSAGMVYHRDTSIDAAIPLRRRPKAVDVSEEVEQPGIRDQGSGRRDDVPDVQSPIPDTRSTIPTPAPRSPTHDSEPLIPKGDTSVTMEEALGKAELEGAAESKTAEQRGASQGGAS